MAGRMAFLLCSAALLFGFGSGVAVAQGDFTFWLVVDKVEPGNSASWVVSGLVAEFPVRMRVDAATKLHDPSGKALSPGSITAGTTLRATAQWQTDLFAATAVTVHNPDEVRVTGVLESVSGDRIRVANSDLLLAEGALSPDAAPGGLVEIRGRFGPDGAMTALSVEPKPALRWFGVLGAVDRLGEHEVILQIASRSIRVTDHETAIFSGSENLALADLQSGQFADISGEFAGNTIVAKKIHVSNPRDVAITGTVAGLSARSLAVNTSERTIGVRTDARTQIAGNLTQDASVGVQAALQRDGSLLASRIQVNAASKEARPTVVKGIVAKVDASSLALSSGTVVYVNQSTVIVSKGVTVTLAYIKAGDQVAAAVTQQSDGKLLATKIEVMVTPPVLTKIRGAITKVDTAYFMVGADKVVTNASTIIVSKGTALTPANLKVGDQVAVVGIRQAEGSLLASKIEVVPPAPVSVTVRGAITSITVSYFMVGADKIVVNAQTVLVSKGAPFSYSNLKTGDQVTVVGTKQAEGSILAGKIEVVPAVPVPAKVSGTITSINGQTLTVGAGKVTVNAQTVIVSKGITVAFASLKVGDQITAVGTMQTDGSILAAKIEVTLPRVIPDSIQGAITSIGNSTFVVAGTTVVVNSQTVIVSKGKVMSFSDLKVGMQVAAVGTKQSGGSILAAKIEIK